MRYKKSLLVFVALLLASLASMSIGCGGAGSEFEVSNLVITPPEVGLGQEVTVTVDVENGGKGDGTASVELKINGKVEDSKEVTLALGESKTVTFIVTRDVEGIYTAEVNGLAATLAVRGEGGCPPVPG